MAGIYGGFFTPIEAAGMGAAVSIVIAGLVGGLTMRGLFRAFVDASIASAMIFAIIIGAEIFSETLSHLPDCPTSWAISSIIWVLVRGRSF